MHTQVLALTLPAVPPAIRTAREEVVRFASLQLLDDETRDRVRLGVSETVTDAVLGCKAGDEIDLRAWGDGNSVHVSVVAPAGRRRDDDGLRRRVIADTTEHVRVDADVEGLRRALLCFDL